jgi:hypothetical protein
MTFHDWTTEDERRWRELNDEYNRLSCCEKYALEKCGPLEVEIRSLRDNVISLESFLRQVNLRLHYLLENKMNADDVKDCAME